MDARPGVPTELNSAGTTFENPYVYDSVARDLKAMTDAGLLKIVHEKTRSGASGPLIERITFERLR